MMQRPRDPSFMDFIGALMQQPMFWVAVVFLILGFLQ